LVGQESQAQNIQSVMQPNLSMIPPLSGSISQCCVSIHCHHEEFLKVESLFFSPIFEYLLLDLGIALAKTLYYKI